MTNSAAELKKRIRFAVTRIKFVDRHLKQDPDNEALKFSLDFEIRSFEHVLGQIGSTHPELVRKIREKQKKYFEMN